MSKHTKGDLKVRNSAPDSRQHWIENDPIEYEGKFKDVYVAFSGFFGTYGPHVFAAAPELLEVLEQTQSLMERLGLQSSDEYQANAEAIAKAKGEK